MRQSNCSPVSVLYKNNLMSRIFRTGATSRNSNCAWDWRSNTSIKDYVNTARFVLFVMTWFVSLMCRAEIIARAARRGAASRCVA